jgi:predicted acylesterase/phospholipase RssA
MHPLAANGRLLLDGGIVSNLPIEPAIREGATEIIALDIAEPRNTFEDTAGLGPWLVRLQNTFFQRQLELETALAAARGVPVRRLWLRFVHPVPIWDFSHTDGRPWQPCAPG